MFKLAKDAITKSSIIFKILLKKVFKFFLCYQIFGFKVMYILMSLLNYCFAKNQDSKKDLIVFIVFSNFKIIFILLTKLIAI